MRYFELNVTSNFTFLVGASRPEELVAHAKALGYSGIAITDECSLAGAVKAHVAAKQHGIKLIVGARFKITQDPPNQPLELILLCPTRQAYAELSAFITRARRRSNKGSYLATINDLSIYLDHVLAIWLPCKDEQMAFNDGAVLNQYFSKRLWIGFANLKQADSFAYYQQLLALSEYFDAPMVAHSDVLMHQPQRLELQQCLTAIHHNQSVGSLGYELIANGEQHLRQLTELTTLYPQALLEETNKIADRCHFSMDSLRYEYPAEIIPQGKDPSDYLRQLTLEGALKRWPNGVPEKVKKLLEYEFSLIKKLQYEHYFLTVYDIVAFARAQGILCQGRGSAANSAVCYCLHITEVDPAQSELLFERFISEERDEPPDIDVDFEHQRREEVIQYIYKKYSRERTALAATVITYRLRSAIRDVGRALGMDLSLLESLSKSLAWWDKTEQLIDYFSEKNIAIDQQLVKHFYRLVTEILGFPRHLSQHVGGFVISRGPLSDLVPVENASMPERTVIQWDKYDIEALKLLKVDILGLGMLSMIRRCLEFTSQYSDIRRLGDITKEDTSTYDMLCRGDTVGVFQIESRAQMSMLPRLKPRRFYDLVIQIAIVRPGPIQGDMVHPYLRRRDGVEDVHYPNDAIKQVLERTLGVPIFQEQVIKMAMVAAGFSGGQSDQLRRAMASFGRNGDLYQFKQQLIEGMLNNGYTLEYAERLFEQMKGFGSYGFPESHSASFAILAYFSSWLKRHHPAAFYTALLNSQPMGFYTPSQLIQDAKRHRIKILSIDIDHSQWLSSLVDISQDKNQQPSIRLGMHLVKGFNQSAAERVIQSRQQRDFAHINDLVKRATLNQNERIALIHANALPRLSKHRYQAQWQALAVEPERPLLSAMEKQSDYDLNDAVELTAPSEIDDLLFDYRSTGLTLNRHPMAILREQQELYRCKQACQLARLRQGQFVKVAGVVTCRQRPGTAKGVLFITLEDETGNMNIIVWRRTFEQYRQAILGSQMLLIKGQIEREKKVIHVVAGHIENISHYLPNFRKRSRDFH